MSLPLAVHHRLDELTELADDTNPTRAELIAALIVFAPTDAEELERQIMSYRKMRVGDLLEPSGDTAGGNVVRLDERLPGRPKHKGAG